MQAHAALFALEAAHSETGVNSMARARDELAKAKQVTRNFVTAKRTRTKHPKQRSNADDGEACMWDVEWHDASMVHNVSTLASSATYGALGDANMVRGASTLASSTPRGAMGDASMVRGTSTASTAPRGAPVKPCDSDRGAWQDNELFASTSDLLPLPPP
jgi:hypothetical protein